ncbi:Ig-like domain-containing protein [Herbiconiux sp. L3-i23]|uniref:Ig-like domain-containing protein n=1 Tax=Herbiconiux sp. L3-i23 TaxID=2905871 RepID=UPI00205FBE64|nr:Ig-like domain-containing protein [Herbiconiux sp. L3-i23]BDI23962.1 hypothetical protein L3i23_27380 [Herbiconiux sp. L3-i23]
MSKTLKSWFAVAVTAAIAAGIAPLGALSASAADAEAPDVAFLSPAAGAVIGNSAAFSFSVTDSSPTHRFLGSKSGVSYVEASTEPSTQFVLDTSGWPEGPVVVTAHAEDTLGNKDAGSTADLTVVVDHTAPVVELSAPAAGAEVTVGDELQIAATITDAHASSLSLAVDGTPVNVRDRDSSPAYAYTLDTALWAVGEHRITIVAVDAAGNTSVEAAVTVVLVAAEGPGEEVPGEEEPGEEEPGQEEPGEEGPVEETPVDQPQQPGQPQQPSGTPQQSGQTPIQQAPQQQFAAQQQTTGTAPAPAAIAAPEVPTLPAPSTAPTSRAADDELDEQLDTFAVPADDEDASAAGDTTDWQSTLLFAGIGLLAALLLLLVIFLIARRRRRQYS